MDFLDYLSRGSVVTFLIIVVYGGYKKWWVFGWVYSEAERRCDALAKEKDAWRDTALRGADIAVQAFEQAQKTKHDA